MKNKENKEIDHYFCLNCRRKFKTIQHFNRPVNQRLDKGMRCEPIRIYKEK